MKKYIVIDTWNGEGYSDQNGVDTKQFQYKKSAFKYAYDRTLSNADGDADLVCRYSDEESDSEHWSPVKRDADGDGFYWDTYDDNSGSYQVYEIKDAYAVMILCNTNEVYMLTEDEYIDRKNELYEDYASAEYTDEIYEEENGDSFYPAIDDYDYQFRLIKNL